MPANNRAQGKAGHRLRSWGALGALALMGMRRAAGRLKRTLARWFPADTTAGALLRRLHARLRGLGRSALRAAAAPADDPCPFPWAQAMILPDGSVRTCCYNSTRLGDVTTQRFAEIWNGPAYRALREQLRHGEYDAAGCGECPLYSRSGWTTAQAVANMFEFTDGTALQRANAQAGLAAIRQQRGTVDASPVVLALELSNRCNYDCVFCFQTDRTSGVTLDQVEDLTRHLDRARKLVCTGGEPFAIKENLVLLESIAADAARHLVLEFYTNGALLHRHWDLLRKFDHVFFVISLHSLDNETYRRIMVARNDVSVVVDNIDRILEIAREKPGWRVSLSNVIMKSTVRECPDLARFAVERGCAVGFYHMHGDYAENIFEKPELLDDPEGALAALREACEVLDRAGPSYETSKQNVLYCLDKLQAALRGAAAPAAAELLQVSVDKVRPAA